MAISKLAKTPPPAIDKGPSCAVCRALEELPKSEADGLRALLADPAWTFRAIAEGIRNDEDLPDEFAWVRKIAHSTYGRHATGGCAAQVRLRARK